MIGASMMLGAGLMVGAVLGSPIAAAPQAVHTATRDVRDCLAVRGRAGQSGYLAATDGGVVWVDDDGTAAAPLTVFDGLPETRAYLVEPVRGSAQAWWVGTEGGLARIERRDAGDLVVTGDWPAAPVRAVIEHDGRTLVGTWGDGVLELRDDALVAVAGPSLSKADRVTALAEFEGAVVAASAGAGAWIVDGAEPQPIAALEGATIWTLEVHDRSLYAGTLLGLRKLGVGGSAQAITVSEVDARALASVDGSLWVGTRGQGVVGVDGAFANGLDASITHVQGLDRDRCVATSEGLWIHAARGWKRTLDEGLPSGDVTAMVEVDGALWVATFEHGVAVLRDGRWRPAPDPNQVIDPQVNALAPSTDGRVWVATTRGLHRVGEAGVETWTTKSGLPHANILSLAPLANGELLVGTHAGVAIVGVDGEVRGLGRRARSWATWAVVEDRDGALWLGTTQGLIHWNPNGTWIHYSMLSGHLADDWVTSLRFVGGALQVGTYAGGVTSLEGEDERWVPTQLGGGRVNPGGLGEVGGRLVVATMKGALLRAGGNWETLAPAPYEDVTAVVQTRAGVWIASRRGLSFHGSPGSGGLRDSAKNKVGTSTD